jgi:anti-sigma regulatory factor (Ser/Thr protein kinase)
VLEVRLPPDPCSVGQARQLVTSQLTSVGLAELADDCALATSELVCNAVMHARTGIVLRVACSEDRARVEVEDGAEAMPRWSPALHTALSGRGLGLVAALAQAWGAEPRPDGKTVWFEIREPAKPAEVDSSLEDLLEAWASLDEDLERPAVDAGGAAVVVLERIDPAQLLAARDHSDDLVRELKLLLLNTEARVTEHADSVAVIRLARRLDAVAEEFADGRRQLRDQALHGVATQQERITVRLHLPGADADAVSRYRTALREADELCQGGHMLLEPADPALLTFREWYLGQICDQLREA